MEDVLEVAEVTDSAAGVEENLESVDAGNIESTETTENIEGEQPEGVDDIEKPEENKDAEDAELVKQLQEKGIPSKYKDLLKKDSFLRNTVMGYKAFRSEFPGGIKEARESRDLIAEIGGKEGIATLQNDAQIISKLDKLIVDGNPEAIDAMIQSSREGFVKLMPSALEKFRESDAEQYNHVMGRVVFNTLQNSPVVEAYRALVKAGDTESAKKLAEFYNGIEALAAKQPEKKIDPERQKLEAEKKTFEESRQQEFTKGVSSEMRTFNAKGLEADLAKQFKLAGKDYEAFKKKVPETVITMLEKANAELLKEMEKDATFVKQHNSLIASRNREKVLEMTQKKSSALIPEVVKKVYRLFNAPGAPVAGKKPATTTDGKPAPAGTIRLKQAPDPAKVDRQRTTDDMIFDNTAYLVGRKEKFIWA